MDIDYSQIKRIAVSCEAGIGASVMGSAVLSNLVKSSQLEVSVEAVAIRNLANDVDLVIVHSGFKPLFTNRNLSFQIMYVDNYLDTDIYNKLIMRMSECLVRENKKL